MSENIEQLSGKSAVITGGTKGIGYAIAEALAARGAKVFICGRNKRELNSAVEKLSKQGTAAGEICDVRNEDQVRMMLEECEAFWRYRYSRQQRGNGDIGKDGRGNVGRGVSSND